MHIAVEGCSHGELDIIYKTIQRLEELHRFKIDLLLCCGDFQSVRNEGDLKCMAVPIKYMQMQDFHGYYSGEKVAPILTIFIGGNHEASNYLQELPYGGWVAPNIYYLGYAGVIRVGDLRIGGLSGIYKGGDYLNGHFEKTPYTGSTMRSVYHIRNLEVFRLKQLSGHTDIFMSHDWPRGIYHYGDVNALLRYKQHFKDEIDNNTLGSRPAEDLIKKLKPAYWFSGHLHVKFAAMLRHEESNGKKSVTKFLALDKCLPRREFLQVLNLPSSTNNLEVHHDAEWLTILRLTNHLLSTNARTVYMPGPGASERYDFTPTPDEIEETISLLGGDLTIPKSNFVQTAPSFNNAYGRLPNMNRVSMPQPLINPQTSKLCSCLGIDDPLVKLLEPLDGRTQDRSMDSSKFNLSANLNSSFVGPFNRSEMNITMNSLHTTSDSFNQSSNPEEVNLSDGDEIEISKDEETGDFILEIPNLSSSFSSSTESKPKFNISPIRGNMSSLSQEMFSSPVASSPRIPLDEVPRRAFSLSKSKISTGDLDLSSLDVSTNEGISSPVMSRLDSSSPSSSDLHNASSQSEEDSDLTDRSLPVKRGSDEDYGGAQSISCDGRKKTKKIKRRNFSVYSSTGEDES